MHYRLHKIPLLALILDPLNIVHSLSLLRSILMVLVNIFDITNRLLFQRWIMSKILTKTIQIHHRKYSLKLSILMLSSHLRLDLSICLFSTGFSHNATVSRLTPLPPLWFKYFFSTPYSRTLLIYFVKLFFSTLSIF